jgi:hypothetical protein
VVSFDVVTDKIFLETLSDLGQGVETAVINELFHVAALLSWGDFCATYRWSEHLRVPIDTYPGAIPYYRFTIGLPQGQAVDIFALSYGENLVLCAVAQ